MIVVWSLKIIVFFLNDVWIFCVTRKLRLVFLLDWRGQRNQQIYKWILINKYSTNKDWSRVTIIATLLLRWSPLSFNIYSWSIYLLLLYGKASLRQISVLWLVLSRSGFCSTDRFNGNGPTRVFLFWSEAGKFKICNQNSEKGLWILSFFTVKLPEEAKKIEIFPKFQRWMKKTNILQASFIILKI